MPKLTKRLIDAMKPSKTDVFVWDGELRGFGVRMKPSGSAAFLVQYRTPQGRARRFAFAKVGTIAPEQARSKAMRMLADVGDGRDPSEECHENRKAMTVAELCAEYLQAARSG